MQRVSWKKQWQQSTWPGFDLIFFDCDSTLSTVEGIDELARQKGKFAEVKRMTDAAMDGEVHLQSIYDRRLELLAPTRAEIRELEYRYRHTLTPDAAEVIAALLSLGKELFVVSGGLLAAVRPFAEWLGIPRQNIRAVDVQYNQLSGQWWDYQQDQWGQRPDERYLDSEDTPLVESEGKLDVVKSLIGDRLGRSLLVGDGMSDVAALPALDLMIGFGGVVARSGVAQQSDIFIHCNLLTLDTLRPLWARAWRSNPIFLFTATAWPRCCPWPLTNSSAPASAAPPTTVCWKRGWRSSRLARWCSMFSGQPVS